MSNTNHTPGRWSVGPKGGCVVTDEPLPQYSGRGGHDEVEYYGGHLIAESIWRPEDARLIAAAPELLEALQDLNRELVLSDVDLDYIESHFRPWLTKAYDAIAKARGES